VIRLSALLLVLAAPAFAQSAADKAAFIAVLEANDCRMNNFGPSDSVLAGLQAAGLTPDKLRPIGQAMIESGEAVADGNFFVLKTGKCA
jgi:hypothetical protein